MYRPSYSIRSYSVTNYQAPASTCHNIKSPFYLRSSWLHKQPNGPLILHDDPTEEMRRIIKYYPKRISSVKRITLAYRDQGFDDDGTNGLYRRILSKYKKDFFRYFCLNLEEEEICPSSSVFLKSLHSVRVLSVHSKSGSIQDYEHFPQILKHNKLLSRLQINTCNNDDNNAEDECFRLRWLRYLPNLRSLQLRHIPDGSPNDWKRSLSKIEILTLFTQVDDEKFEQLVQGLQIISQLNSLKKVNLELDISNNKVLESIPFDDFNKNKIAYDLRLKTNDATKSRKINFGGLSQIDFLGISYRGGESSFTLNALHDPLQLSSIELQQQSQNLFFLAGANQNCLSDLLKSCLNIISLDLILSGEKEDQRSLPNLNHLINLRNLSLKIIEYDKSFDKQWKTLANFAHKNQNLTYLNLKFESGSMAKGSCKNIGIFFEHLKGSLTTLLLSFEDIDLEEEISKVFLQSISSLHKLKSLYLNESSLVESLKTSLPCDLEELNLDVDENITMKVLQMICKAAPKLTKMRLSVLNFEENLNVFKALSNLKGLKELEFVAYNLSEKNWKTLIKTLPKLNNLQILKVANWDPQNFLVNVDEGEIQQIIKNHPSLKLVARGWRYPYTETLRIVIQKKYLYNIDSFLFGFKHGLLDNLDYKICYI